MKELFDMFSTREKAIMVWSALAFVFFLVKKDSRHAITNFIKALFYKKLIFALCTFIMYMLLVVLFLSYFSFWDLSLLKDTVLWFLFTGVFLFMKTNKVENQKFFYDLVKANFKLILIWEFIFNLYTLSFVEELFFIPTVFLFTITEVFAEHSSNKDEKTNLMVATFCKKALVLIGFITIVYVLYRTVTEYKLLFTIPNLKSFLLPIILLILTLPFFYGLVLYMNYEQYTSAVKNFYRNEDKKISKDLIKATYKYANIDIKKIKRTWKYVTYFCPSKDNAYEFIKNVSRNPKYIISNKAKFVMFNDIKKMIKNLSHIGIGELCEWHKSYANDDYYLSTITCFEFGKDHITQISNSIALNLIGDETYIRKMEVVLCIGYNHDKYTAKRKYVEVLKQIFKSLSIPLQSELSNSISEDRQYNKQYSNYVVSLNYEKFERLAEYFVCITTN